MKTDGSSFDDFGWDLDLDSLSGICLYFGLKQSKQHRMDMRHITSWRKPVEIGGSLVVACCVYRHEVSAVAFHQASASSFATRVETSWAAALSTSITWHLKCEPGFQLVLLGSDNMVIIFSLGWCFIEIKKNSKYDQIDSTTTINRSNHTFIISTTSFWVFSNTGFFLAHTHTHI